MARGRKLAANLERRVRDWEEMKSEGASAPNSKYVKGCGTFRKPGSRKK